MLVPFESGGGGRINFINGTVKRTSGGKEWTGILFKFFIYFHFRTKFRAEQQKQNNESLLQESKM